MNPNSCPTCDAPQGPSAGYATWKCAQCETSLLILRHKGNAYFFDSGDIDTYRVHAATCRHEERSDLARNGWIECNDDSDHPFNTFAQKRNFSLQRSKLIEVTDLAIGLDFSDLKPPSRTASDLRKNVERKLRKLAIDAFSECSPDQICYAIDVNHAAYSFRPTVVETKASTDWPVSITPYAEFIAFNTACFSQGLFVNPRTTMLVAYGASFCDRFSDDFRSRLVDPQSALM